MCKGQCPGTAIDGDWRNRTEHCDVWKTLYTRLERDLQDEGIEPLSTSPIRPDLEGAFLDSWSGGANTSMAHVLSSRPGDRPAQGAWRTELNRLRMEAKQRQRDGSGG